MRKKAYWQCLMIAYGADPTGNTFFVRLLQLWKAFPPAGGRSGSAHMPRLPQPHGNRGRREHMRTETRKEVTRPFLM